jgi:hypothetical protein
MTNGTVGQLFDMNAVLCHQLRAKGCLIGRCGIAHGEDSLTRAHVLGRVAVAIETPIHLQALHFGHHRHLIDPAMTSFTADALLDMNGMIKVNKIRQVMHANPCQGLTGFGAAAHEFQVRGILSHLPVTPHTGFGGGNAGRITFFHRRMTIAAVQPQPTDMLGMAIGVPPVLSPRQLPS